MKRRLEDWLTLAWVWRLIVGPSLYVFAWTGLALVAVYMALRLLMNVW